MSKRDEIIYTYHCPDNEEACSGDCKECEKEIAEMLDDFAKEIRADAIEDVELSLREAGYEYDENMGVGDNVGSAMLGVYAKGYNKGYEEKCLKVRAEAIEEYNKALKAYLRRFSVQSVSDKDFDYVANQLRNEKNVEAIL